MTAWGAPGWLWAIWLLPALAALAGWQLRDLWRQHFEFAPSPLWKRMRMRSDLVERAVRQVLGIVAIALVVVSLADPRGPGPQADAHRAGRVLVLLDVSKSMRARDALGAQGQATSRFEAATSLLRDILTLLDGWNFGLVVFAGDPVVLSPTTDDDQAVLTLLARARPGDPSMRQGTDLEHALSASAALLGSRPGAMLLLTDGEELTGQARNAVRLLRARHIPLYAVGLGLERGAPVTDTDGTALTWHDEPVVSARNDSLLRDLARRTGGRYFPSRTATSIDAGDVAAAPAAIDVVSGLKAPAAAGRPLGASRRGKPLALALWVLALQSLLTVASRLRAVRMPSRIAPGALEQATTVVVAVCWPLLAMASLGWTWPSWSLTRQAVAAHQAGRSQVAVSLLERAARQDPSNPEVRFDLANALCAAAQRQRAVAEYRTARAHLARRSLLAEHAWYNEGNAWFLQGNLREAARCYRQALALDAHDADAAHNLALCQPPRPAGGSGSSGGSSGAAPPGAPTDTDRLLRALEEDERTRQAVAAQRAAQQADSDDPAAIARKMLRQAGRSVGLPSERDW